MLALAHDHRAVVTGQLAPGTGCFQSVLANAALAMLLCARPLPGCYRSPMAYGYHEKVRVENVYICFFTILMAAGDFAGANFVPDCGLAESSW